MAGGVPCELAALVVVVLPRCVTAALLGLLPQAVASRPQLAINRRIRGALRRASGTGELSGLFMGFVVAKALLQQRNRAGGLPVR